MQTFEEFREEILKEDLFKKTPRKTLPQIKKILKVLFDNKKLKLRSSEISNKTKIEKKYVDSRLNKLARIDLVKVS
jgi:Fic family protein